MTEKVEQKYSELERLAIDSVVGLEWSNLPVEKVDLVRYLVATSDALLVKDDKVVRKENPDSPTEKEPRYKMTHGADINENTKLGFFEQKDNPIEKAVGIKTFQTNLVLVKDSTFVKIIGAYMSFTFREYGRNVLLEIYDEGKRLEKAVNEKAFEA